MLASTWIKGDAMPGGLVDEVLRALGLERETEEERQRRWQSSRANRIPEQISRDLGHEQRSDDESESKGGDVAGVPEHKGE